MGQESRHLRARIQRHHACTVHRRARCRGDAFFILPFASTFLPGSIVTFLVFGPIIDIKMLAMLRTTFTTRVLIQLTVMVGLLSALLGLVVNVVA
jgi:uncharacterized protein